MVNKQKRKQLKSLKKKCIYQINGFIQKTTFFLDCRKINAVFCSYGIHEFKRSEIVKTVTKDKVTVERFYADEYLNVDEIQNYNTYVKAINDYMFTYRKMLRRLNVINTFKKASLNEQVLRSTICNANQFLVHLIHIVEYEYILINYFKTFFEKLTCNTQEILKQSLLFICSFFAGEQTQHNYSNNFKNVDTIEMINHKGQKDIIILNYSQN